MDTTAANLTSHLVGKKIAGFSLYNVGDHFMVFDPSCLWAFDGGIQIDFADGSLLSFGMNLEFEAFDYSTEAPMLTFLSGERVTGYKVDDDVTAALQSLHGTTITDVRYIWDYYQEYDAEAQLKDEKIYIPVELKFAFDNGQSLQIAAALYGISQETGLPANMRYDFYGQLVVSFDKELEIAVPEHIS